MTEILFITAIHISIMLIPGPDFFVLLANSLGTSKLRTAQCAAGYSLATCSHGGLFAAGLGLLITESPQVHSLLIVVGALVFIATGVGIATSTPKTDFTDGATGVGDLFRHPFIQAFFTNFTNAKAVIYMLALVSQLINSETALIEQVSWLAYITLISFAGMLLLGLSFQRVGKAYLSAEFQMRLQKMSGLLLILFGIGVLISNSVIAEYVGKINY